MIAKCWTSRTSRARRRDTLARSSKRAPRLSWSGRQGVSLRQALAALGPETRSLPEVIANAHPAALWIGAFVVLVLRRPQAILHPGFVYEDGQQFFMTAWYEGFGSLNKEYGGVLYVGTRLIALAEQFIPIGYAPLFGQIISLAIVAAIAAYIASRALENVVPDRRVRLALALVFLLLSNTEMTLGRPTFLQFYFGVFMVAAAVAARAGVFTLGGLALMGATGPFGILMTPLFAVRAWIRQDRDSLVRLAAIGIPAVVQTVLLLGADRQGYVPPPTLDPTDVALILGGHLIVELIGGVYTVQALTLNLPLWATAPITVALVVLIMAAARSLDRRELLVLGYASAAVIGASLVLGTAEREQWLIPYSAARYFIIPGAMLGALIVLTTARRNRAGMVLALVLAAGLVGDFRLQEPEGHHWRAESACIGGPAPCTVPVSPGGIWDIHYEPGRRSW